MTTKSPIHNGGTMEQDEQECEGGEPCWFNRETGYTEYCPKHEAIIADKAMESLNWAEGR